MSEHRREVSSQMAQMILSQWVSRPIGVAAKLNIADILAKGPMEIGVLAETCGVHAGALYRLMRALASVGVFSEVSPGCFGSTPLGDCLQTGQYRGMAMMFNASWHDAAWAQLEYSVRTGKSGFEKAFGMPATEWLREHPNEAAVFHQAQFENTSAKFKMIAASYPFTGYPSIVDVGGGHGGLVIEILKRHPSGTGQILDLPYAAEGADTQIKNAGLEERLSFVPGDFFVSVPSGSDLYVLSFVLHDFNNDTCQKILAQCRKAKGPGGRLLIAEHIVPEGNTPSPAKLMDLEMLVMASSGEERTLEEYQALIEQAEMKISQIVPTPEGTSLIEVT